MELFSNVNYLRIRTQGKTASFVSVLSFQSCPILQHHGLEPTRLLRPCDSQARILEWVAISFSRGSSRPKDQTQVSHVAGGLFRLSHQGSPFCHRPIAKKVTGLFFFSFFGNTIVFPQLVLKLTLCLKTGK